MRSWTILAPALGAALVIAGTAVAQPPPRGPGGRGGPGGLERALDDLKLTGTQQDKAEGVLKAFQEKSRKAADQARADLLKDIKGCLTADQFQQFEKALAVQGLARRPGGPGRGASADDLVERVMSFDKNKDGKVTKEELPERMHYLIGLGDTNKDGALDRKEIEALVKRLNEDRPQRGRGGPPPGGPPGGPGAPGGVERALDDLKLADKQKHKVQDVLQAHREKTRTSREQARANMLEEMKGILTEDQFKQFEKAAADRGGPGGRPGRP